MKFRFPYVNDTTVPLASVPRPSYPTPYLWHPRALAPVRLSGPKRTRPVTPVLVDTGATETLFKHHYARLLGVTLTSHPTWQVTWKGTAHAIEYGDVILELTDVDGKKLRWEATVGFTTAPLTHEGLLGFLGCLRYMDARFLGEMQDLELEPNGLFTTIGGVEILA